ncbi:lysophospholipid acyltransferase family protein [Stutzerimonas balearica]|uniref:lysophospholipid acyltransferase family protein n=1 Tax=Stutzerimonas balearica TaxID=74829 RepID=UPI0028AC018E|nr:lysophospholipid acyltransferase family protein [Stutzerimonas balearica]
MSTGRLCTRLFRLAPVLLAGLLTAAGLACRERLGCPASAAVRQRLTQRFLGRVTAALPLRVRVIGQPAEQPMLWLANHISWVDIPVLGGVAPLSFLAKQEVARWPLLGYLARQAGTAFIFRGAGDSRRVGEQLAERLAGRQSLLIFAEGTSTDGSRLRRFHPRLLEAAVVSGAAIQPVALRYRRDGRPDRITPYIDDDELPAHLFRLLRHGTVEVEVLLLPPIVSAGRSRSELAALAHGAIAEALFGAERPLAQAA